MDALSCGESFPPCAFMAFSWRENHRLEHYLSFCRGPGGRHLRQGENTPPDGPSASYCFFVTSPAEEIFWRGFLQRRLMLRLGSFWGWIIASVLYAAVHISSLNFMLVGAAGVAGLFWGLLYWRLKTLWPVVIIPCRLDLPRVCGGPTFIHEGRGSECLTLQNQNARSSAFIQREVQPRTENFRHVEA